MLEEKVRDAITLVASEQGLSAAALMAVVEVESGGQIFALVDARNEPLIRFEGHYFYRLLGAADRNRAVTRGLAARLAGKIGNPRTQAARWKLLGKAMEIDRNAALQSVSWGIGQVMGAHWRWLDYASLDGMVSQARSGLEGQLDLMLRFIDKSGLSNSLLEEDWRGFARGYNGPSFAKHGYDRKLKKAHQRYLSLTGEPHRKQGSGRNQQLLLKYGDSGELVRELQFCLQRHGHMLIADGDFGSATRRAVEHFQASNELIVDGVVGPKTFISLSRPTKNILIQSI